MIPADEPLVAKYKALLTGLLNLRASGPVSMDEESRFATELTDIWWQLSNAAQAHLETWIEAEKAGAHE